MRRKEMIKPDLHDDYKHLCSSSIEPTSFLFGDELIEWERKSLIRVARRQMPLGTKVGPPLDMAETADITHQNGLLF